MDFGGWRCGQPASFSNAPLVGSVTPFFPLSEFQGSAYPSLLEYHIDTALLSVVLVLCIVYFKYSMLTIKCNSMQSDMKQMDIKALSGFQIMDNYQCTPFLSICLEYILFVYYVFYDLLISKCSKWANRELWMNFLQLHNKYACIKHYFYKNMASTHLLLTLFVYNILHNIEKVIVWLYVRWNCKQVILFSSSLI